MPNEMLNLERRIYVQGYAEPIVIEAADAANITLEKTKEIVNSLHNDVPIDANYGWVKMTDPDGYEWVKGSVIPVDHTKG